MAISAGTWVFTCRFSVVWTRVVRKLPSRRKATIGRWGKMRLVTGSSGITLKLSSRFRCTRVFKGWYVSIKGILLIYSSVELLLVRASLWDRCFMFSRSCCSVCALYPRLWKKEAISWALFRKSAWSEQMRGRRRSWLYGRLSLRWRGCDES